MPAARCYDDSRPLTIAINGVADSEGHLSWKPVSQEKSRPRLREAPAPQSEGPIEKACLICPSNLVELLHVACVEPIDERSRIERSEEHTSELQSLMRNSYAVFCLKKK